jgi:hypothetical protein
LVVKRTPSRGQYHPIIRQLNHLANLIGPAHLVMLQSSISGFKWQHKKISVQQKLIGGYIINKKILVLGLLCEY